MLQAYKYMRVLKHFASSFIGSSSTDHLKEIILCFYTDMGVTRKSISRFAQVTQNLIKLQ
mgnify:CR=1 FL=1